MIEIPDDARCDACGTPVSEAAGWVYTSATDQPAEQDTLHCLRCTQELMTTAVRLWATASGAADVER